MFGPLSGWWLSTVGRQERDATGSNVTISAVRPMEDDEVKSTQAAVALMGNVSAHVLTEPIRRVANELGQFIETRLTSRTPPDLVEWQVEASIAFDNFLNQVPLCRSRMLRNVKLFLDMSVHDRVLASFQAEYQQPNAWRTLWELRRYGGRGWGLAHM